MCLSDQEQEVATEQDPPGGSGLRTRGRWREGIKYLVIFGFYSLRKDINNLALRRKMNSRGRKITVGVLSIIGEHRA